MVLIHIISAVIGGLLKAATASFVGLVSVLISSLLVLGLVGFLAFGLSGMVGLKLSRKNRKAR